MSANGTTAPGPDRSWAWPFALVLVLALHGVALFLFERRRIIEDPVMPSEAVLIDLMPPAPALATPPATATPPEPPVKPVEPLPEPPLPLPRVAHVNPEVALPRHLPPRPVSRLRAIPAQVSTQTEVPPSPMTTEVARALPSVAAAPSPASAAAAANWASQLAAHLLRFRHYPPEAERRGMMGVVMMRFSVDATGHIVSSSMARSSGHGTLDEEAEAWLRRAQPLPPPPSDKVAPAQIVVPLQFVLQ